MDISLAKKIQSFVGVAADGIIGPKTISAIASKLKCDSTIKAIQTSVGVVSDGIIGDKTLNAIIKKLNIGEISQIPSISNNSKLDVFLDAGHTKDFAREHPNAFTGVDWTSGTTGEIAKILGFTKSTNDSLEHMLNVAMCKSAEKALIKKGKSVLYYDDPSLSNDAEIGQVYRRSNAAKPKVFVSIHNNAAGSSNWKSLKCSASGTVACYKDGRTSCKNLSKKIADSLIACRKKHNGPHNRASSLMTTSVGVLNKADASIPATLIEVGFYDNIEDLYWMVTHLNEIGEAIADGIIDYIG